MDGIVRIIYGITYDPLVRRTTEPREKGMAASEVHRLTYEHVNCAVIVAHPNDETLWAGGTLLMHPDSCWTVVALTCRDDSDRASKFQEALEHYGAKGIMGDLDDGPGQKPLRTVEVEDAIMALLPSHRYDLIFTHSLWGEYTRHRGHEAVAFVASVVFADLCLHCLTVGSPSGARCPTAFRRTTRRG